MFCDTEFKRDTERELMQTCLSTIEQLDGNDTCNISTNSSVSSAHSKTTDPEVFRVAVVNARSVANKLDDIVNLSVVGNDIILVSETWEREGLVDSITEMQELNALTWISRPRACGIGGGVAVVVRNDFGKTVKIEFPNPDGFEIVWAVISPNRRPKMKLIVASFYSPPSTSKYSTEYGTLQDYVLETLGLCAERFPDARVIIAGDINDDDLSLLELEDFQQVVDRPTRQGHLLDVLYTDLGSRLIKMQAPLSTNKDIPSDHSIPLIECQYPPRSGLWSVCVKRRCNEKGLEGYRKNLAQVDWKSLLSVGSLEDQVGTFQ